MLQWKQATWVEKSERGRQGRREGKETRSMPSHDSPMNKKL